MSLEFPSGPWRGYWLEPHGSTKHRMRLDLKFAASRMMGDGDDEVGYFVINGKYDGETGACGWTKTYPKRHQVLYDGKGTGNRIAGTWILPGDRSGRFLIWAGESEEGPSEESSEKRQKPIAASRGGRRPRIRARPARSGPGRPARS